MRLSLVAVFLALPCVEMQAQWIKLATPGVPRLADGKPNLTAPAPKANGKPDLSGLWVPRDERPCNPTASLCGGELPLSPYLGNFARDLAGGLPYQPWAADLVKSRAKDVGYIDPHAQCMPPNFPRAWAFPETIKILQSPAQLTLLHEWNASYRQIFTDGRKLPSDMTPTWQGYSVAHWEGSTLVVESAGYRDDSWLDTNGNFFSNAARVTERITRPNFGSLNIDITIDDPKVFTKPWTVSLHMKPLLDTEMIDFMCQENNKDLVHMVR